MQARVVEQQLRAEKRGITETSCEPGSLLDPDKIALPQCGIGWG
jgi:hypothetical protein